jgi:hypothetical protein
MGGAPRERSAGRRERPLRPVGKAGKALRLSTKQQVLGERSRYKPIEPIMAAQTRFAIRPVAAIPK